MKTAESESFNEWWSSAGKNWRAIAEISDDDPEYNLARHAWNSALLKAIVELNDMLNYEH